MLKVPNEAPRCKNCECFIESSSGVCEESDASEICVRNHHIRIYVQSAGAKICHEDKSAGTISVKETSKHVSCWKWLFKKKKKEKGSDSPVEKSESQQMHNANTQISELEASKSDSTETSISLDKSSGDGVTLSLLQNWLKFETKQNNKILEDLLLESHEQKRELLELKDMLLKIAKTLHDIEQSLDARRHSLERKSNIMSFHDSKESEIAKKLVQEAEMTEEEPKKKRKWLCF